MVVLCCGAVNAPQTVLAWLTCKSQPANVPLYPSPPPFPDLILPQWGNETRLHVDLGVGVSEPAWGRREALGEELHSADFSVMTGQLWERGSSSGTTSQRATRTVEPLSSDAHVRARSLGPGFVLHITLACTAAAGGQVLISRKVTFCNTWQVFRAVRVSPCSAR